MSEPTNLPYYCPTFRTSHLLEPCTKNLARVKALKEAKKHVGPLEVCVDCKGKMLIKVPEPLKTVIEGLPAPENWVEERFMNTEPPGYVSPERKEWEPHPEVTTAPLFLKDTLPAKGWEGAEYKPPESFEPYLQQPFPEPEMRQLSPEAIAAGRKAGHNLGKKYKTRRVLDSESLLSPEKEEIYHRIIAKQEKIVPEASNIVQVKPEVLEQRVLEGKVAAFSPLPRDYGARYCPTHPEMLQRIDKMGRWMGMCDACLSARGKKCGLENFERGVTAPPVSIPLNLPKFAEVKAWLEEQADENERSLGQQIMMILKTAWRQGI